VKIPVEVAVPVAAAMPLAATATVPLPAAAHAAATHSTATTHAAATPHAGARCGINGRESPENQSQDSDDSEGSVCHSQPPHDRDHCITFLRRMGAAPPQSRPAGDA